MTRRKKKLILAPIERPGSKNIKVKLDERTVITIASMSKFAFWKSRYPKAKVIS